MARVPDRARMLAGLATRWPGRGCLSPGAQEDGAGCLGRATGGAACANPEGLCRPTAKCRWIRWNAGRWLSANWPSRSRCMRACRPCSMPSSVTGGPAARRNFVGRSDIAARIEKIAGACGALVEQMEFGFLFDRSANCWRSAIASTTRRWTPTPMTFWPRKPAGQLHRHRQRRYSHPPLVPSGPDADALGARFGAAVWSGSMFEYLMPSLSCMSPPEACWRSAPGRGQAADPLRDAPGHSLGMSESQYYALDRDQNYQYSGFGVPDLGIKRGLSENT